jgi:hypothetical protein
MFDWRSGGRGFGFGCSEPRALRPAAVTPDLILIQTCVFKISESPSRFQLFGNTWSELLLVPEMVGVKQSNHFVGGEGFASPCSSHGDFVSNAGTRIATQTVPSPVGCKNPPSAANADSRLEP